MLREFKFPDVGEGIAEGEIVHWLVKEGDWIEEDQDLVQVETDKAVITLHSPFTGKIEKLYGKEGEVIKVGALLTTVQDGGEAAPAPPSEKTDSGTVVGSLGEEKEIEIVRSVLATPAVRALAKQMKLDLAAVKGTGPGGRITKEDVQRASGRIAEPPGVAGGSVWSGGKSLAAGTPADGRQAHGRSLEAGRSSYPLGRRRYYRVGTAPRRRQKAR